MTTNPHPEPDITTLDRVVQTIETKPWPESRLRGDGMEQSNGIFLIWQSMTAQVNGFLPSQEPCLWCDDGNRSLRSSREELGRAHPRRGASTSSRGWLVTVLKIVLSCFDLLVRELQSDFTSSGTLQGPGVFVMCG